MHPVHCSWNEMNTRVSKTPTAFINFLTNCDHWKRLFLHLFAQYYIFLMIATHNQLHIYGLSVVNLLDTSPGKALHLWWGALWYESWHSNIQWFMLCHQSHIFCRESVWKSERKKIALFILELKLCQHLNIIDCILFSFFVKHFFF